MPPCYNTHDLHNGSSNEKANKQRRDSQVWKIRRGMDGIRLSSDEDERQDRTA